MQFPKLIRQIIRNDLFLPLVYLFIFSFTYIIYIYLWNQSGQDFFFDGNLFYLWLPNETGILNFPSVFLIFNFIFFKENRKKLICYFIGIALTFMQISIIFNNLDIPVTDVCFKFLFSTLIFTEVNEQRLLIHFNVLVPLFHLVYIFFKQRGVIF